MISYGGKKRSYFGLEAYRYSPRQMEGTELRRMHHNDTNHCNMYHDDNKLDGS